MRLVYQCDNFLPDIIGGAEVFSVHLLKAFQSRGHDVLVLTSRPANQRLAEHAIFEGINIRKFDFHRVLQTRDLSAYARTCAEVDDAISTFAADALLLSDTARSGFFFLRQRLARNIPRLLTLHSPLREGSRDTLQYRLMLDASKIVAVSRSVYDDAVAVMPSIGPKLVQITNALPAPALLPSSLPFAPPRILFAGRLPHEKGADVAIQAIALIRDQGPKLELEIAGDGPQRLELQSLAHNLGLDDQVHFSGWTAPEQIPALIDTATAVLVPSRWREPFGLVALQAMQMGRPVIASAVGGLPEIVADGETGFLVPPDEPVAMAEAILRLIRSPETATRMGEAARLRAGQRFNFGLLVDAYEAAIVAMVNTPQVNISS